MKKKITLDNYRALNLEFSKTISSEEKKTIVTLVKTIIAEQYNQLGSELHISNIVCRSESEVGTEPQFATLRSNGICMFPESAEPTLSKEQLLRYQVQMLSSLRDMLLLEEDLCICNSATSIITQIATFCNSQITKFRITAYENLELCRDIIEYNENLMHHTLDIELVLFGIILNKTLMEIVDDYSTNAWARLPILKKFYLEWNTEISEFDLFKAAKHDGISTGFLDDLYEFIENSVNELVSIIKQYNIFKHVMLCNDTTSIFTKPIVFTKSDVASITKSNLTYHEGACVLYGAITNGCLLDLVDFPVENTKLYKTRKLKNQLSSILKYVLIGD